MKKISIAALMAAASFSVMSFSSPAPTACCKPMPAAAKVNWTKEAHDFGEIPQGKPVSVEFTFTNSGDEPLLVADVQTSCGCTASDYTKEPIAPGKSSKIKVTYNAAAMGAFTKTITVNFQDEGLRKILNIKGTVK